MTETQQEAVKGLKLKMLSHFHMDDCGILHSRCDEIGLSRVVRTPKKDGQWGNGVVTWISDAEPETEHDNLSDALRACGIE